MLQIEHLSKSYGEFKALDDLNLQVSKGRVTGFLGANGAGKTTTLSIVAGLLKPDCGDVLVDGHSVISDPIKAKRALGYVPDKPELFEYMTPRELFMLCGSIFSLPKTEIENGMELFLEFFNLSAWADELCGSFSHGMRQKLMISLALLHKPTVLILDEPLVGLDPRGSLQLKALLKKLAEAGITVLLSIHTLEIAEKLCDELAILRQGRLVVQGTQGEIQTQLKQSGDLESTFLNITEETFSDNEMERLVQWLLIS